MDKPFTWNPEKSEELRTRHGFGFEEVLQVIETDGILDLIDNPSRNFPQQQALVVKLDSYPVVVPFVENEKEFFLKTAFPNRKLKTRY